MLLQPGIFPIDEDGHGTALTTLLLRVARNADIYVFRIARRREHLQSSQQRIAAAILYAAEDCGVDIISMSFGFSTEVESISKAITKALSIKKDRIAFFAAAANDGSNYREMFPAHMQSVISVRGTDSMGGFIPAYDPAPFVETRLFGTLGQDVPYDLLDQKKVRSGCSLATPILAGISAMIVHYAWSNSSESDRAGILARIRGSDGIFQILKDIAIDKGNNRYYVAPFEFLKRMRTACRRYEQHLESCPREVDQMAPRQDSARRLEATKHSRSDAQEAEMLIWSVTRHNEQQECLDLNDHVTMGWRFVDQHLVQVLVQRFGYPSSQYTSTRPGFAKHPIRNLIMTRCVSRQRNSISRYQRSITKLFSKFLDPVP